MERAVEDGAGDPPPPWSYAVCYGLYALILAGCYVSFWSWRSTAEVVVSYLFRDADALDSTLNAVYLVATLAIGLVLFGLAVGSEPYLRAGLERPRARERRRGRGPLGRLGTRFARVALPLAGAMFLAVWLQDWGLTGAVAEASRPRPGLTARTSQVGGAGGVTPPPTTQDRGTSAVGPWIAGAMLAIAGTVVLAATRRRPL